MGQKHSREKKDNNSDIFKTNPLDIVKEIINSSNFYQNSIINSNLMWKTNSLLNWKNYQYKIEANLDKINFYLYNLPPFNIIPIIKNNQETCYICLGTNNINCKMVCCNQYLHLKCGSKMIPSNYCTICRKDNYLKIKIFYCKNCNEIIYSNDFKCKKCNIVFL